MRPLQRGGQTEQVRLNDRFFFGGPLFLRGFKYGGIGPRSSDDPLGGTVYAAACARLSSPLGSLGGVPVRGQVFVDAGALFIVEFFFISLPSLLFFYLFLFFAHVHKRTNNKIKAATLLGNLLNVNHPSAAEVWREAQSSMRASCGFGVALGVGGRLELNITTPLAKQEQDVCPSNRFQIGFGLRFL